MANHIKAGVIGVGSMGKNHARVYAQALPEVKLVGVADLDKEKALSVAQSYECRAYQNYRELLEEDLDLVSIALFYKDKILSLGKATELAGLSQWEFIDKK